MAGALLVAVALAAAAAPLKGPKAETLSALLEARMAELERLWQEENDKVLAAGQAILIVSPSERSALMKRLEESRRTTRPLIIEMTVLARRLQRYRETGELPETIDDLAEVERLIDDPWAALPADADPLEKVTKVRELPLDLGELIKELERYARPARQTLAPPPALPVARRLGPASLPRMERDAGRGRRRTDPVPELVELLSAPEARQRALAADMLGSLGPEAKAAVPQLRRALADADARVRASAAQALGRTAAVEAEGDLRERLKDADGEVRRSTKRALEELGGRRP